MFGEFLLEAGVDVELHADLGEVLDLLHNHIPNFSCNGVGFRLTGFNGVAGSKWRMFVKPLDREEGVMLEPAVGYIEVAKLDQGLTGFKIPPRDQWRIGEEPISESEARRFSSFIFQLLNTLQGKGLIDLPGQLPVV